MKYISFFISIVFMILCIQELPGQNKENTKTSNYSQGTLKKLTGTWKLIEYADLDSITGKWKYDYGRHPKGFFTYTKTGIVNLNISADTALRISEDSAKNYNVNLLSWVYNCAVGYFGTYSVDFNRSLLTHHVTGGSLPWYIGTDQPRPFSFKGDTLLIGDNKTWKRLLIKAD